MNRYAYRVHGEGPVRHAHRPHHNAEALVAALRRFCEALPGHLEVMGAKAELPANLGSDQTSVRLGVVASLDWAQVSLAIKGCADRFGLHVARVATLPASVGKGVAGIAGRHIVG